MKHWKPSTESYVALILVSAGVLPPLILRAPLTEQMSPFLFFAWLFAVSGVRRATGVARVAAIASLTVLVFHAILLGILAILIQTTA